MTVRGLVQSSQAHPDSAFQQAIMRNERFVHLALRVTGLACLVVLVGHAPLVCGQDSRVRQAPRKLDPSERGIGRIQEDVAFLTLDGDLQRLLPPEPHAATVVAITSTSCPLSKKYLPTLKAIASEFAPKDVRFLLVNPVAADREDRMQTAAKTFGDTATYVFDKTQAIAQSTRATTTTDVIVLDSKGVVRYQGAIDDQHGLGYSREQPHEKYLATALENILQGNTIDCVATTAPGCTLAFRGAHSSDVVSEVNYHDQIARLMAERCVQCHRDGGVAPFTLTSYDDVVSHASMIRDVVSRRVMPPWFAASIGDEDESPWLNDCSLSDEQVESLVSWIDNDMPVGDGSESVVMPEFPGGWLIGAPDAVYGFKEPVAIKASGIMPYQNIIVETDQDSDRWVQAIEIRPGDPSVVHHVIVSVLPPKSGWFGFGRSESRDNEADGYWGAYVPGMSKIVFPEGYGRLLPKGSRLKFQMHYTPNGRATEDLTRIGLRFCDETPEYEVKVSGLANGRFRIPPGADNHEVQSSIRLPFDAEVIAYLPHAHLRGKACRYEVDYADGRTELLLDVPEYDFNWQLRYEYREHRRFDRGDTLRYTAWYDNSESNPANPDPTATVRWGQQTFDEMHLGYIEYVIPNSDSDEPSRIRMRDRVASGVRDRSNERLFDQFDLDGDEQITRAEVKTRLPDGNSNALRIFERLDRDGNDHLDRREFRLLDQSVRGS